MLTDHADDDLADGRAALLSGWSSGSEPGLVISVEAAFHFRSGEHGESPGQGTLPVFTTWKVLTPAPMFTAERASTEYRTRTFATVISGSRGGVAAAR